MPLKEECVFPDLLPSPGKWALGESGQPNSLVPVQPQLAGRGAWLLWVFKDLRFLCHSDLGNALPFPA